MNKCNKKLLQKLWLIAFAFIGFWLCYPVEARAESYTFEGVTYDINDAVKYSNKYGTAYLFEDSETLLVTAFGTNTSIASNYPWGKLSSFTKVYFTDAVSSIGSHSFYGNTTITEMILPSKLTSIGNYAFYNCSGLTGDLIIPDSVESLGSSTFEGCSGFSGKLKLSKSLTAISPSCFQGCSGLTGELVIPDSVIEIGWSAFAGCEGLTGSLNFPNNLETIDSYAFQGCSNFSGDLLLPNSLNNLGSGAFNNCSSLDGNLYIPDSIEIIGIYTFKNCTSLSGELLLPSNLTHINASAFEGCKELTGPLKFPETLTYIGGAAFKDCTGFTGDLILPNSISTLYDSAFENCSGFNGELRLPENITSIPTACFKNCSNLTGNLIIPTSVSEINPEAFYNCRRLGPTLDLNMTCSEYTVIHVNSAGKGPFNEMYGISKIIGCSDALDASHTCTALNNVYKSSLFSLSEYGVATECLGVYPYSSESTMWNCNRQPITVEFRVDGVPVETREVFNCNESTGISVPDTTPTKDGYVFTGWYYQFQDELNKFTDETSVCQNVAKETSGSYFSYIVNAEFVEDKTGTFCEVTFADKDASGTTIYDVLEVPWGTCVQPIASPSHQDSDTYKFCAWLSDGKTFDFETIITEDIMLYASWDTYEYYSLDFYTGYDWDSYYGEYQGTLTFREDEYPMPVEVEPKLGYRLSAWYRGYYPGEIPTELFDFKDFLEYDDFVYAQWEECSCIVTFDTGTSVEVPAQTVPYYSKATQPDISFEGHELVGWYTDAGELYDFSEPVTSDLNLTAIWKLNKYTVTFSDNLTGYTYLKSVDWNTQVTAPEPPVRNGYTLVGWYIDKAGTVAFDFNTPITQDITVYAKWEKDSSIYTVIYISSDGLLLDTLYVTSGTILTEPTLPVKVGHIFKGWFLGDVLYDFEQPVISNLVLTQRWDSITHTVTFDSDGGSVVPEQEVVDGGLVSSPVSPEKSGYTFAGWYLGDSLYEFSSPVTESMTLTAKWKKINNNYTVIFIRDINSESESFTVEEGTTLTEPATPVKDGYIFKGWFVANTLYDFDLPVTCDLVIIAKWEKEVINYNVKFVVDETVVTAVTVEEDKVVAEPTTPTKSGYVFKGWYLGDSPYNFSTPVTQDITLVAKWEKDIVYHEVHFSDGTGSNTVKVKDGDKVTEPTQPVKSGYYFKGWCGDSAGKTDNYNFDKEVTSDLWLYARWEDASIPAVEPATTEPEPSEPESEPESKTPTKSESEPKTEPKESTEPESKQSHISKLQELTPMPSEEEEESPVELESEEVVIEEESVPEEIFFEEETVSSQDIIATTETPTVTKKQKNSHGWRWLLLILLILLLPFIFLFFWFKRIKVFAEISSDNDDSEFEQIYKTFVNRKDNVHQISIPSHITQDYLSDVYKILLTEHFVKKHAGEELYVNIAIGEEHFSILFILEEGIVELLFNVHEDCQLNSAVVSSESEDASANI